MGIEGKNEVFNKNMDNKLPEIQTLGASQPSSTWSFSVTENDKIEYIMKISQGKFFWKGKEVKDVHKIYERFNDWLTRAEKSRVCKCK